MTRIKTMKQKMAKSTNNIQGDPPITEMDDEILALLIQVFCSKEIQGEEDEK